MSTIVNSISPIRQAAVISAIAVLLSFTLTGSLYLLFFGLDARFWQVMALAIMVPWGISIPLSLYMSKQRAKLVGVMNRLKLTQGKLRRANKALEHRANYDGMTGLPNRESFFASLEQLRSDDVDNVLMIVDADHFKNINDNYGHPIGDKALILIAEVFRKTLRKSDLVGRIGGEEFGIFLPDTSEAEGQIIGEMIRHEMENTIFEPHKGIRHVITVSIGLTNTSQPCERAVIMGRADAALFTAKRRGRNQVVLFEPGMRAQQRPTIDTARELQFRVANAQFD